MKNDRSAFVIAVLCAVSGLEVSAHAAEAKCRELVTGAAVRDASEAKAKDLAIADWSQKSKDSGAATAWQTAQAKNLACTKIEGDVFECKAAAKPCSATTKAKGKPAAASKAAPRKPPVRRGSGE